MIAKFNKLLYNNMMHRKISFLALTLTALLGMPVSALAQQYITPEQALGNEQNVLLPPRPRDVDARVREQYLHSNTYLLQQQAASAAAAQSSVTSTSVSSLHPGAPATTSAEEHRQLRLFLREEAARRLEQGRPLTHTGPETWLAIVVLAVAAGVTIARSRKAQKA